MVHFFGILSPGFGKRAASDEAPHKVGFFGGAPDAAFGAVPLSRVEQEACYLAGKAPEPDLLDVAAEPPQPFVSRYTF